MAGKSPVVATEDQRAALTALAASADRGEADRARALLLTLSGWTSARIAEAFGVREDTVRLWAQRLHGWLHRSAQKERRPRSRAGKIRSGAESR